jgi:putative flippase GtrA
MKIKKELIRFIIAGSIAFVFDYSGYYFFSFFVSFDLSKAFSFVIGTTVAFFINKYWTFEQKEKRYSEVVKFIVLYSFTLGINVFVNKLMLNATHIVFISFVIATASSMVANFIGQKWFVFKQSE